jgi:hypothetical protein
MEKHSDFAYSLSKLKLSKCQSSEPVEIPDQVDELLSTSESSKNCLFHPGPQDSKSHSSSLAVSFPLSKPFSKTLQQKISKSSPSELEDLIKLVLPQMPSLMVDPFGNYICQTLFHTCSAEQRLVLLTSLKGKMTEISFDARGTHSLQNLVSMASLKQEEKVYQEEFAGKILMMSLNINASHVVQKMLTSLSNNFFIIKEVKNNTKLLATDKFGVCLLKKCCTNPEIMTEVLGESLFLMQHPYGNYAVQAILENWKEEIAFEFFGMISGKITQLCLQKYASNVIEKAAKVEYIKNCILKELLETDKIKELLMNQYGCYVLRTFAKSDWQGFHESLSSCLKEIPKTSQKLSPLWKDISLELMKRGR